MKTIHFLRGTRLSAAAVLLALLACNKTDFPDNPGGGSSDEPYFCEGKYLVLNNGAWGNNDASLGRWQDSGKTYYSGAFYGVNKQHLGDLGQDMLVYGSKVYIAVSGSKKIFVTDLDLHLLATINPDNCQPRQMVSHEGKVYATIYEGFLAEIDTTDYSLRKVAVGDYPEGVAILDGKAYVACSGGLNHPDYGKTMDVVNLENWIKFMSLNVNDNPVGVWASGTNVYVLSYGNYKYTEPDYAPAMLQVYSTSAGTVTDTGYANVSLCARYGDILYVLTDAYSEGGAKIQMHAMASNTGQGQFLPAGTNIQKAYSLSATKDYLWIGLSDYVTPGEMWVWKREAQESYARFGTLGINPQKVAELPR